MKSPKRIVALAGVLVLLLSLGAAQATDADADAAVVSMFTPDDMAVSGLQLYATRDEAEALFGEPLSVESYVSGATGDTQEIWYYDGLTLTFGDQETLVGVAVSGAQYVGPRGVQIGQTLQEIAAKFYFNYNTDSETVLYTSGYVEMLDDQLPPCGVIVPNEDGTFALNYVAPSEPFDDSVLADPMNYIYENLALFSVNFDANAVATDFSWQMGPWAE